jgi:hypothetical protein
VKGSRRPRCRGLFEDQRVRIAFDTPACHRQ